MGESAILDHRPNIVIVVLDCVRAEDFPGGTAPVPGMPAVEALTDDGVRFPKAIAPSPWTLPSHASILTGLEPWQHNLHLRGRVFLNPALRTLPSVLGSTGYRTLLLSGNSLLSPETGFSTQFQASATAAWWEPFLRHTGFFPEVANGDSNRRTHPPSSFGKMRRLSVELLLRYPAIVDGVNRVSAHTLDPETHRVGVSPWIEPTLERWIEKQPADQPIFSMINLIDAHDPYLTDPAQNGGVRAWWRKVSVPQQYAAYKFSGLEATPKRVEVLRALYRDSIRSLDRRVGHIIRVLQEANRWNNTLFVLTSDHGQALLEKGHLFHGQRVDEQITRIPLTVRFPESQFAGAIADGWSSLVDIAPLIYRLTGVAPPSAMSGVDLGSLIGKPRPSPAVAISDGIVGGDQAAAWVPAAMLPKLHHVMAAVYSGDWKVVVEQHEPVAKAYNLALDPAETVDRWAAEGPRLQSEAEMGRWVVNRIVDSPTSQMNPEVLRRLEGWGYI